MNNTPIIPQGRTVNLILTILASQSGSLAPLNPDDITGMSLTLTGPNKSLESVAWTKADNESVNISDARFATLLAGTHSLTGLVSYAGGTQAFTVKNALTVDPDAAHTTSTFYLPPVALTSEDVYDAPQDGDQYARRNGRWEKLVSIPSGTLTANKQYARKDGDWTEVDAAGEAPNDGKQYAAKNCTWAEAKIEEEMVDVYSVPSAGEFVKHINVYYNTNGTISATTANSHSWIFNTGSHDSFTAAGLRAIQFDSLNADNTLSGASTSTTLTKPFIAVSLEDSSAFPYAASKRFFWLDHITNSSRKNTQSLSDSLDAAEIYSFASSDTVSSLMDASTLVTWLKAPNSGISPSVANMTSFSITNRSYFPYPYSPIRLHSFIQLYMCNPRLREFDMSFYDISSVTSFERCFTNCPALEAVNMSGSNFASNTSFRMIFFDDPALKTVDLTEVDTPVLSNLFRAFAKCSSLDHLDCSSLNTARVTDFGGMFSACTSLSSLNLTDISASSATSVSDMFKDCQSLTTLTGGSLSANDQVLTGLKISLSLADTDLDRPSIRAVINGIADLSSTTSQVLTLGETLKSRLLQEDIDILTAKNWTIA